MNVIAIIPARMGSSRFPGKPLAPIRGMPMVGHVYVRTRMSKSVSETWVATCDREIFEYIESIGGKAVMTADTHERCTDRTAEAMFKIEESTGRKVDIVVMVQGDEPLVTPGMIDEAVAALRDDPSVGISCLMGEIERMEDFKDPNEIKVVTDLKGYALYFSREPIPSPSRQADGGAMLKQVCIIPFQRDSLLRFNSLPSTPLEIVESVDLMRVLEHGDKLKMVMTRDRNVSVDTPEDLASAEKAMETDQLVKTYLDVRVRA